MTRSRLVPAVLAMIAILLAADLLLPDLGSSVAWSVGQSVLVFFLAAVAGAWVARGPFAATALVVWALFWAVVAWLLHRIGAPVGQGSFAAILQYNWLAIVLSGAATLAGAVSGKVLAPRAGASTTAPRAG